MEMVEAWMGVKGGEREGSGMREERGRLEWDCHVPVDSKTS